MRFSFQRSLYFVALFGALILLLPTFLNNYPIFYPDSSTYVRGPDYAIRKIVDSRLTTIWSNVEVANNNDAITHEITPKVSKTILSGRSVYYGLLVYLGYVASDFWLTAFLQAYIVATIVGLLFFRCWRILSTKKYFLTLACLSVLTPLGFFVGFMMPDIFASVAILATMIVFVYWEQLKGIDIVFLAAMLVLSFAAHSSHIAFTLIVIPVLIIIGIASKKERSARFRALALIIFSLMSAGVLELAFYQTTLKLTGNPPLRLPYMTARLIELGPGLQYLDQACTPPQFAVCAYRARLPLSWTGFMFDPDPKTGVFAPADFPTKRRLSEEQTRFAVQVLLYEPLQTVGGLLYDFGRQLTAFSFVDQKRTYQSSAFLDDNYPPQVRDRIKTSELYEHPEILQRWATVNYAVAVIAALMLAIGLLRLQSSDLEMNSAFTLAMWITILGLVANAFVCGVLASPLDRFQARVIWLVPLLAFGIWYMNRRGSLSAVRSSRSKEVTLAANR